MRPTVTRHAPLLARVGPLAPAARAGPGALLGLSALLGLAACEPRPGGASAAPPFRGVELPPAPLPDFTLTDMRGGDFRFREEARGRATLLFFGYTHCPDVCPVHLANIAAALDRSTLDVRRRVRVVFVTTDPERDTPERLRAWLGGFDPSFIGLRGPLERVNAIQESLGLPPASQLPADADGYDIGHSARVLAFAADGSRRVAYAFGTRQADWAHDLPLLVEPGEVPAGAAGG